MRQSQILLENVHTIAFYRTKLHICQMYFFNPNAFERRLFTHVLYIYTTHLALILFL